MNSLFSLVFFFVFSIRLDMLLQKKREPGLLLPSFCSFLNLILEKEMATHSSVLAWRIKEMTQFFIQYIILNCILLQHIFHSFCVIFWSPIWGSGHIGIILVIYCPINELFIVIIWQLPKSWIMNQPSNHMLSVCNSGIYLLGLVMSIQPLQMIQNKTYYEN